MGEVWVGRHGTQDVPLAVKVITSDRSRTSHYLQAFRREVQTMAGLDHPCIITVFDYGEVRAEAALASGGRLTEGSPYLAMELATGGTLLSLHGRLLWPHLRVVLLDVLDGLAHAHARGVIHRDLKPENVLLFDQPDGFPALKLTDFGLAHSADAGGSTDAAGSTAGTPEYMAPEQLMGHWRDYGPWTDLYAVGVMAYQLCTGFLPFFHDDIRELMRAHIYDPAPLMVPRMDVPDAFHGWVSRLLAKHPRDRFQFAADAAWALFNMPADLGPSPEVVSGVLEVVESANHTVTLGLPSEAVVPLLMSPSGDPLGDPLGDLLGRPAAGATPPLAERDRPTEPDIHSGVIELLPMMSAEDAHPYELPPIPEHWRRTEPERSIQLCGAGLGLYGLRPVPLVDRVGERDAIWTALQDLHTRRHAQALLLHGASGAGKSRLAEWMLERAHEVGAALTLKVSHSKQGGAAEGFARALSQHLGCGGLTPEAIYQRCLALLTRLGRPDDALDARVLTELLSPCGDRSAGALPATKTAPALRDAVIHRLLIDLAARRPLMVWVDDIQWGPESLRLMEYTLSRQRAHDAPVLFLVTLNDETLRPATSRSLDAFATRPQVKRVEVGPLPERDHLALVHQLLRLKGTLADQVAARTSGNPLFAIQLVGDWVDRGVLVVGREGFELRDGEDAPLPDDIHQLWRARLDDLLNRFPATHRPAALRCLELAATLGRDVDMSEWRTVCDLQGVTPPPHFVTLMLTARLARRTDAGWSFDHGMFCESVQRLAAEQGRATDHHRACADMLRAYYDNGQRALAARYAQHLIASDQQDAALSPLLMAANEAANAGEFDRAQALLLTRADALTALGLPPDDPRWAESYLCEAAMRASQGLLDDALRALSQAQPIADALPLVAAECMRIRGLIARKRGDLSGGIDAFNTALSLYQRLYIPEGVAHCLSGLGSLHQALGDWPTSNHLFNAAIDLFEPLGLLDGVGICLNGLAENCRQVRDLDRAYELLQRAISYLERADDRLGVAGCLNDLGDVCRTQRRLQDAATFYRQALERLEALSPQEALIPQHNLGLVHLARGHYQEAARTFQQVLSALEPASRPGYEASLHVALLPCAAHARDWAQWDAHFAQAQRLLDLHPQAHDDIAWTAELAGDLAGEARQSARAQRAYTIALHTWQTLRRDDRSQALARRLPSPPPAAPP
jgi:serine/threonine protein kinase/tetratricopeptide (TPR) repeat protein